MEPLHKFDDEYEESQRALVVPSDWLIQTCSTLGCSVVIRSRAGQQGPFAPVCKWCQAGTAHYRQADSPMRRNDGPCLDREEFGRDLYDAIVLQASLVMARQNAERWRGQGLTEQADESDRVARWAERELGRLLDHGTIAPGDVRRLLTIGAARTIDQGAA